MRKQAANYKKAQPFIHLALKTQNIVDTFSLDNVPTMLVKQRDDSKYLKKLMPCHANEASTLTYLPSTGCAPMPVIMECRRGAEQAFLPQNRKRL